MRAIKKIILHCTDTPDSDDSWDVNRLRKLHVEERGWADIGYHIVITRPEGTIQFGRPIEEIGSHAEGYNSDSIGCAWVGRCVPTDDQIKSLKFVLTDLLTMYKLSVFDIWGHHDFNSSKSCPNLNVGLIRLLCLADYDYVTLAKKEGK